MVINKINEWIFNVRLERAIKAAAIAHAHDGRTYIVVRWKNRPVAIAKGRIKQLINERKLKTTIEYVEKHALFIAK
jgi:hypothetical protein